MRVKYKLVEFYTKEGTFTVREIESKVICPPTIHKGLWGYYQFILTSSTPKDVRCSKGAILQRAIEDVLTELSIGHSTLASYRKLKNLLEKGLEDGAT